MHVGESHSLLGKFTRRPSVGPYPAGPVKTPLLSSCDQSASNIQIYTHFFDIKSSTNFFARILLSSPMFCRKFDLLSPSQANDLALFRTQWELRILRFPPLFLSHFCIQLMIQYPLSFHLLSRIEPIPLFSISSLQVLKPISKGAYGRV